MTVRTATLEADLATIPGTTIAGRTVVALPPSDLDVPSGVIDATTYDALTTYDASTTYFIDYLYELIRVYVGGYLVNRAYDSTLEQP